jgi:hypothetical protein
VRFLGAVAALAGCAALAACSSTTSGNGQIGNASTRPAHDFPSSVAPVSTPAAPVTSGAPATTPAVTTPAASIQPAPSAPLRTVTVHATDGTTYVIRIWQHVEDPTCFDHAYGAPVISFLTKHPCFGLVRYLATTTVKGRPVGFAESSTGFAGTASNPYKYSSAFVTLEKSDGTGSIDDLLRDGYRLPSGPTSLPSSEAFDVLGQDEGVAIYDAWYLDGSTPNNDPALIKMTQDIFLQF